MKFLIVFTAILALSSAISMGGGGVLGLGGIGSQVGGIVGGVLDLVAGPLKSLQDIVGQLKISAGGTSNDTMVKITDIIEKLVSIVKELPSAIELGAGGKIIEKLSDILKNVINDLVKILSKLVNGEALNKIVEELVALVTMFADELGKLINEVGGLAGGILKKACVELKDLVEKLKGLLVDSGNVKDLVERISKLITDILDRLTKLGAEKEIVNKFGETLDKVIAALRDLTKSVEVGTGGAENKIGEKIGELLQKIIDSLGEPLKEIGDGTVATVKVGEKVLALVKDLKDGLMNLKDQGDDAKELIKNTIGLLDVVLEELPGFLKALLEKAVSVGSSGV